MQRAFILVNAEPGKLWKIADSATKVRGVKMAYAVTGGFDVVIYAEIADMDELGDLIDKIHSINGVTGTQTAIAIPRRVDQTPRK